MMAVILSENTGYVLDGEQFGREIYSGTLFDHSPLSSLSPLEGDANVGDPVEVGDSVTQTSCASRRDLQFKKALFDIRAPFIMDSEFEKIRRQLLSSASPVRNRKRKAVESEPDVVHRRLLQSIVDNVENYWTTVPDSEHVDNNVDARRVAREIEALPFDIPHRQVFSNHFDRPVARIHGKFTYIIPALSTYIASSFRDIRCAVDIKKTFDFILMDPPWNNKSAKRLRTYNHLDEKKLKNIPVCALSREGTLISVWVTNNERLQLFVETELFASWNAVKEAEWTWMKVTKSGEPIYPFSSPHKKPYEKILFARIGNIPAGAKKIPNGKVIVSVPSALHSQKPVLSRVLQEFLPEKPDCLELFARSLVPGWTSWGLEVAKLQNVAMFESA